jgi:hypothetical protein
MLGKGREEDTARLRGKEKKHDKKNDVNWWCGGGKGRVVVSGLGDARTWLAGSALRRLMVAT